MTSDALGDEWVRKLPYGVSAEGVALRNLNLASTRLNPAPSSIRTATGSARRCAAWYVVCWLPATNGSCPAGTY